jgi:hypothetical protein
MHAALLAALLAFQQPTADSTSPTTPPTRDTVGYWQQRVRYVVTATLDERRGAARGRATMTYVNNSPDTLRELYVHQYLNAFRPGSKWSAADEREGRVRFQKLAEPNFAYERFTEAPTVDGTPVAPEYPGGPDSTVARLALPRPLAPGDSLVATFAWEARPSTVPRRQGRRGRSFDFAQWYPKVAVYDRFGWEPHAFVPAGELYGEFGDYDVTLVVPEDQVLGASGVVVDGDPGWARVLRWGTVRRDANAYGAAAVATPVAGAPEAVVPSGFKRVRFLARDVHHFAWSASPDYRYEGGVYVRPAGAPAMRFPTWDTVAVHVLYRPGDEGEWGGGQAVERTRRALRWLEHVYGPYGYPQITNLHRIEGGGTEFPMMMMNGSASQGLILHEGGHIYSYGMLANNEWRSGWMDEGLTQYQTEWAQGLTRHDRAKRVTPLDSLIAAERGTPAPPRPAPPKPTGYRRLAVRPAPGEAGALQQYRLDLIGRAEPIGTPGEKFNEFGIYNSMIYERAAMMYDALRDVLGEDAWRSFLRDYYARWAFRHVDEAAMRGAAERAHGRDLGWFFAQWVHRTGLVDYALRDARVRRDGEQEVTRGRAVRLDRYDHPATLGARTPEGWSTARADSLAREQEVAVRTAARPAAVRLDPARTSPDWYRPNDGTGLGGLGGARYVFDWPFLDQALADRYVVALTPLGWYGDPGGVRVGGRARASYQGWVNRVELGVAALTQLPDGLCPAQVGVVCPAGSPASSRWAGWLSFADPRLPWSGGRPVVGLAGGAWRLDGITKVELRRSWDRSPFLLSRGNRSSVTLAVTGTYPYDRNLFDARRWSGRSATEASVGYSLRTPDPRPLTFRSALAVGVLAGSEARSDGRWYARGEAEGTATRRSASGRWTTLARAYAGWTESAPPERQVYLSAQSPTESFLNHFLRPAGAPLSRADWRYVPLGGAGLRGYSPFVAAGRVASVNAEQDLLLRSFGAAARPLRVSAAAFGDVGVVLQGDRATATRGLGDLGLGVVARGALFDRDVRARVDFPLYVSRPELAAEPRAGRGGGGWGTRVTFSFSDLW